MIRRKLLSLWSCCLRISCGHGLVLLLCATAASAGPEGSAETGRWAKQEQRGRYTDELRILRARLQKLQGLAQHASKAQRTLRARPSHTADRTTAKTLERWRDVERRTHRLIESIQATIRKLEARFAPPRMPMAKNVVLTRLDGKRERMAQHRGDVVLLHFWATWCGPCVKEIDALQLICYRFQKRDFAVVAVSLDARAKDVRRFLRRNGLRFPVYLDAGRAVYERMIGGAAVLPRSLLIDKEGRIVRSYAGARHLASPVTFADIRQLLISN